MLRQEIKRVARGIQNPAQDSERTAGSGERGLAAPDQQQRQQQSHDLAHGQRRERRGGLNAADQQEEHAKGGAGENGQGKAPPVDRLPVRAGASDQPDANQRGDEAQHLQRRRQGGGQGDEHHWQGRAHYAGSGRDDSGAANRQPTI